MEQTIKNEKLLTAYFIAERLDLSVETVYRLIRTKKIKSYRFGGSVKVREKDFDEYVKNCCQ